ncbi:restriction endonuclease subunit S [Pygmaiobacter massiliensis]|uniref:restriction endonuclease subunit S n=1 Tax=Pygmaiobacter massiliensis TaxID=1917873 RepID=UPI000C7C6049|nr:restriction endonuclease subunit S [Pygmaiobacter massiliensis]
MAKKKESLSFEKRLEKALVPDWKQPYKVPNNWVWTSVGIVCKLQNGEKQSENALPYLEAKYLRGKIEATIKTSGHFIAKNSKVILVDGENSGEVFSIGEDGYMGSTFKKMETTELINSSLFEYFICIYQDYFRNSKTGSAIPHLNKELFYNLSFPLPPLAEQQRIIDRIGILFAKLDEAKEKAQFALNSFETHKAAVLHKAFKGELTAKWRKENGVGSDSWVSTPSNSVFSYITSGSRGWAQYYSDSGAIFIRMGNLDHGTIKIDYSDIQYVDLPDRAEGQRSLVRRNDILVSITADVGMIGIVEDDSTEAYINQHVALARPVPTVNARFIAWFFVSDLGLGQLQNLERGATKKGLSLQDLKSLRITLPTLREQSEIVRILDSIFEKEEQAKDLASVIEKIDLMKKAILARAFRGELGTNNPAEESAIELLKAVIQEKINGSFKNSDTKNMIKKVKLKESEGKEVAKTILEALQENKELTPEKLKALTGLEIDDFYEKLKELVNDGKVIERRENGESFLEVVHAS